MEQGMEHPLATTVWRELIASSPLIEAVGAFTYAPTPPMQQRNVFTLSELRCLSDADKLSKETGRPFCECLAERAYEDPEPTGHLLLALTWQNPSQVTPTWFTRGAVLAGELARAATQSNEDGVALAMVSHVKTARGRLHVPMLDLRPDNSGPLPSGLVRLSRFLMSSGGWLLKTDRSFHLLGKALIPESEWSAFMGRSLLFAPLVDRAYVAHHLMRGFGTLRVSAQADGTAPYLVHEIPRHI